MSDFVTPADITASAKRKVGSVVKSMVDSMVRGTVDDLFPMPIRIKVRVSSGQKPSLQEFASATQTLLAGSKSQTGLGYTVELVRRKSRLYGEQDFPDRIVIETLDDFVSITRCETVLHRVRTVCQRVHNSFPELSQWLVDHATKLERYADAVSDLIAVCKVLSGRPMPDCYLRELDVPVDTKFIEKNEAVLRQWLDILLPASAIDVGETKFCRRYGLRDGRPHHLVRLLDTTMIAELRFPCEELSMPMRNLGKLSVTRADAIIVENRTTLLTLPPMPRTIALGGVGDSVTRLRDAHWLHDCERLLYWGDLDVDGFRILSNLRRLFPATVSILMDESTFNAHQDQAVQGNGRTHQSLPNLTQAENQLMERLGKANRRIEQESIPQSYVREFLRSP
jgi:hypothetical protein